MRKLFLILLTIHGCTAGALAQGYLISDSVPSDMLDEVVVTALGISKSEKSLGYAATQVDASEIERAHVSNVMEGLKGKVAGLQIQTMSPDPGMANNVTIRGLGSLSGSNQPLYVVDDVPIETTSYNSDYGHAVAAGGIHNLSPDDIASLTVLKGMAASALYGSRAANGVIIITTKSGKGAGGKNYTVTYSGTVEANRVSLLPEMQNKWGQGWNGSQTFIENASWGPALDGSIQSYGPVWNNSQLSHKYSAKKNNVREFYDTGIAQTHNIAISGTNQDRKITYYTSYSYTWNDGVIPTDDDSYRRNTITFKGTFQPEKWFKISTAMNFANWKTKSVDCYQGTSTIDGLLNVPRDISIVDMKDLNSAFNTPEAYFTPYGVTNPYWALANNYNVLNGKQTFGKLQADIFPINGLTLTYRFGFDYSDYDQKDGFPQISLDDALIDNDYGYAPSNMNQAGNVYTQYRRQYELNHDFLANYNRNFLDHRLELNATIGFNVSERAATYMEGRTEELAINSGFWDLSNGATLVTLSEAQSKRRLIGLFGDVSLGWNNFLYLNLTARNDWSSTLPKANNSFFYPGVTLSGIFTKFIPKNDVLTFGKLRLAYGKTGNDTSPYKTHTNYLQAYTNGYYGDYIIKFPFNAYNAFMAGSTSGAHTLRPEMTAEFEAGTNLKFLNGRIDLDVSYYNRISSDQIFTLPVEPATGFLSQVVNFGKVRNRGVEVMLNTVPVQTENLTWELGFNFSKNYNKVLAIPENLEGGRALIYAIGANNGPVYMYAEEGKAIGQYYAYFPQYVTEESSPYYGSPIVDANGQPILNYAAQATGFNMNHQWTGGVTTALTLYGVTLSAAFDMRYGGKMFSATKNTMQYTGNGKLTEENERRPFIIPNSVVKNSDGSYSENNTPIYMANGTLLNYFNTYGRGNGGLTYLIDRTYCKLRNISLSWSLPKKWMNSIRMNEIILTAYCNNPFIWTAKDNRYVDPESTTAIRYNDLAYSFGELYANPSYRTFGFNLKVTF